MVFQTFVLVYRLSCTTGPCCLYQHMATINKYVVVLTSEEDMVRKGSLRAPPTIDWQVAVDGTEHGSKCLREAIMQHIASGGRPKATAAVASMLTAHAFYECVRFLSAAECSFKFVLV